MSLNINPFPAAMGSSAAPGSDVAVSPAGASPVVVCPHCVMGLPAEEINTGWSKCPYCEQRLQVRMWPLVRESSNAAVAISDQATCFFHPDKAFQACCHRCGRFLCALCDLQLGADHVCPPCFERGRGDSETAAGSAEWRYRDVLYDSIAAVVGWAWILFWPSFVVALPAAIFLHVKYRKAPRSYLVPRSGWRFWSAYAGLAWLPLLFAVSFVIEKVARKH